MSLREEDVELYIYGFDEVFYNVEVEIVLIVWFWVSFIIGYYYNNVNKINLDCGLVCIVFFILFLL